MSSDYETNVVPQDQETSLLVSTTPVPESTESSGGIIESISNLATAIIDTAKETYSEVAVGLEQMTKTVSKLFYLIF